MLDDLTTENVSRVTSAKDRTSTRPCSMCSVKHAGPGRYCKPCHAAYMRRWRAGESSRLKRLERMAAGLRKLVEAR